MLQRSVLKKTKIKHTSSTIIIQLRRCVFAAGLPLTQDKLFDTYALLDVQRKHKSDVILFNKFIATTFVFSGAGGGSWWKQK